MGYPTCRFLNLVERLHPYCPRNLASSTRFSHHGNLRSPHLPLLLVCCPQTLEEVFAAPPPWLWLAQWAMAYQRDLHVYLATTSEPLPMYHADLQAAVQERADRPRAPATVPPSPSAHVWGGGATGGYLAWDAGCFWRDTQALQRALGGMNEGSRCRRIRIFWKEAKQV